MPLEARGVFDDAGEGTLMRGEPGRVSPEASKIAKNRAHESGDPLFNRYENRC